MNIDPRLYLFLIVSAFIFGATRPSDPPIDPPIITVNADQCDWLGVCEEPSRVLL